VWDFGAPGKEWMSFLLGNEKQNPDFRLLDLVGIAYGTRNRQNKRSKKGLMTK